MFGGILANLTLHARSSLCRQWDKMSTDRHVEMSSWQRSTPVATTPTCRTHSWLSTVVASATARGLERLMLSDQYPIFPGLLLGPKQGYWVTTQSPFPSLVSLAPLLTQLDRYHKNTSALTIAAFSSQSFQSGLEPVETFNLTDKHARQAARAVEDSSSLSLTARAGQYADAVLLRPRNPRAPGKPSKPSKPSCSGLTNVGDAYTKAGKQVQLTGVLSCASNEPCNQQVGKQIAVGHTVTSTKSNTFTWGGGASVSVEVGSKLPTT